MVASDRGKKLNKNGRDVRYWQSSRKTNSASSERDRRAGIDLSNIPSFLP